MIELKVTIELPGMPEALNHLADAIMANANARATEGLTNLLSMSGSAPAPILDMFPGEPAPVAVEAAPAAPEETAAEKQEKPKRTRASKKTVVEVPALVEQPEDAPPMVTVPQTAAPVTPPVMAAPVAPMAPVASPEIAQAVAPVMAPVNPPVMAATQVAAAPAPVANAPVYTIDMLSKAGTALLDKGGMTALLGLLAEFGIQSMMELKPEQYTAFALRMKEIGADLP